VAVTPARPTTLKDGHGHARSSAAAGLRVGGRQLAVSTVLLVVVALAGGAWAASSARRADGEELARELRERAPELASEVEDPGTESDEPTRTGPE